MSDSYSGYDKSDEVSVYTYKDVRSVVEDINEIKPISYSAYINRDTTIPEGYPHAKIEPISIDDNYIEKWIKEIKGLTYNSKVGMSFVLPLMLIPLAAKAVKMGIDYAEKKKKEVKK